MKLYRLSISANLLRMPNFIKQRTMKSTFKTHLSNAKKETLISAWQYLKPTQKATLFIRAWWWSQPTIHQHIAHLQTRVNVWLTYRLYKAHWM